MKRKKYWILLLITFFLLTSCVYYNTFYNAKKFFKKAHDLPVGANGKPSQNAIQNYNKASKKCGIILTEYKKSQYADDALFMLARCLFYSGRSYIQASEKFKELITFYPESEFVAEAKIYLAKADFKLNNKAESYRQLHEISNDPETKDKHSATLLILANYYLEDKDYTQAVNYFQKILDKYPKSDEYEEAFFSLGETYQVAGDYEKSNEVFFRLLKSRVERKIKMNARYLIAKNYLLLEDFEKSAEISQKLLKDEYRENKISKTQLLVARSYSGLDQTEDAINIFDSVILDNPKTELSAEAYFYYAEMYFEIIHDYEKAIENYNKVKTEYRNSEFVKSSVAKSAVASQIIQYYNPDSNIATEDLVNQQFKLAEFYIETLNIPDSALIVYDKILSRKNILIEQLDSLKIKRGKLEITLDSLAILDSLASLDTLKIDDKKLSEIDSLFSSHEDSLIIEPQIMKDSLKVSFPGDSLIVMDTLSFSDSTLAENIEQKPAKSPHVQMNEVTSQITRKEEDVIKFDEEFIPRILFIKLWLHKNVYLDSVQVENFHQQLLSDFPENNYTKAAALMLEGKPIIIVDEEEERQLSEYQTAIENMQAAPEKAIENLKFIATDEDHDYYEKATYSLGYINYFLLEDSLAAKPFFDSLLVNNANNEYKIAINTFYDGTHFLKLEHLPYIEEMIEKEKEKQMEEEEKAAVEFMEEHIVSDEYDIPPQIIFQPDLTFPPHLDYKDEIILELEILTDGTVGEIVYIIPEAPSQNLQQVINKYIPQCKFSPAIKDNEQIDGKLTFPVSFD
ncbi:MAG: tetratricopeptide repeat protein [Candidatus Cloacimonetes bacterium]|nr:tetratricopeptide repeat protein [Candidatus Cloacimonadota bacterium]